MERLGNDALTCPDPGIVAGRLLSIRNIYLRQELRTISEQIQEKHKERLPALQLVTIAAYEQVFNRQPLSLPEELRQAAVNYGLRYYQLYLDKLRLVETQNGLFPQHSALSEGTEGPSHTNTVNNNILNSPTTSITGLSTTSSERQSKIPQIIVREASDSRIISSTTSDLLEDE